MDPNKIHGAYFVPGDGIAKAVRAGEAMARDAGERASFHGNVTVEGIEVKNGRIHAVRTSEGRIQTEQVLVCAGIWGPRVGEMAAVPIPLTPIEHIYTITEPLADLAGKTREVVHPVLRHQDSAMYFRQHADCYGIGSYRHTPLLVDPHDILDHDQAANTPAIREFTPEHFEAAHEAAIELMPPLRGAELPYRINGMFSFTPDGMPLLGESPDVKGFWVAEAIWITHAGGAGKAMAEWMVEGTPSSDLREADLNRFAPHALTPSYVKARGAQQYREVYDIIHPLQQMENPRRLRLSPFYERQRDLGAVFFENTGWEQPQWFESNDDLERDPSWPDRSGWEAINWSLTQGSEHRATRENVTLYDLSPFTKIEVSGAGALGFLQHIAANRIDQPVGKVIYTSLLTGRGGIKCDLTITRLEEDRFLVLTGAAAGSRDLAWIRFQAPSDDSVRIADITSSLCGVGLWGPRARDLLQQVCDDDVTNSSFTYFTTKDLSIDHIPALALRLSYAGELGWEIYTASETGLRLWDILWEAGRPMGMVPLGSGAFDSLRLEKGYRLWGTDIHTDYNPLEAGLAWAVDFEKDDFIGKIALLRAKDAGTNRKLCCMTLDDPEAVILGKEPILDGDRVLGYVTSTNRGYTVGSHIAYGYLPVSYAEKGTSVEIEYFGHRFEATVVKEPLWDPKRKRLIC